MLALRRYRVLISTDITDTAAKALKTLRTRHPQITQKRIGTTLEDILTHLLSLRLKLKDETNEERKKLETAELNNYLDMQKQMKQQKAINHAIIIHKNSNTFKYENEVLTMTLEISLNDENRKHLLPMEDEAWENLITVQLMDVVLMTKTVLLKMLQRKKTNNKTRTKTTKISAKTNRNKRNDRNARRTKRTSNIRPVSDIREKRT